MPAWSILARTNLKKKKKRKKEKENLLKATFARM
jgi:hypothetical protein